MLLPKATGVTAATCLVGLRRSLVSILSSIHWTPLFPRCLYEPLGGYNTCVHFAVPASEAGRRSDKLYFLV